MNASTERAPDCEIKLYEIAEKEALVRKVEIFQEIQLENNEEEDRGWAWVVFVATFLGRLIVIGTLLTFNVYFTIFLDIFHEARGFTALIGSILWASFDSTAIISGYVVNKMGPRITTIMGGSMMAASLALSSFATNIYHLIFTMGFIVGLGTQFVSMGCVQGLRNYFKRYQNFVQGVSTAGAGIGMLILGRILPLILDLYGWRGTIAIHGALILNICVAGAVMFPVRSSSSSQIIKEDDSQLPKQTPMREICFRVCIDCHFWCILLSYFFFGFSYVIMTVLFNDYVNVKGLGEHLPLAHSSFAIGDIIGRVGSGITSCLHITPLAMSMLIHLSQAILQFIFPFVTVHWELYICSVLYGISTGCANGLFFVVPCHLYQSDDFLVRFPYLSTAAGLGNLIGTPIAGSLTDVTGSYTAALLLAGSSAFLAASLLLPIIIVRSKYNQKDI